MNTPHDPDAWQEWQDDFLGLAPQRPEMPDPRVLAEQVRRETRRMRWGLAREVFAALVVVAFWLISLTHEPTSAILVMACVNVAAMVAWVGYLVHTFRGQWMPVGDSARAHLAATLQRRQSEARWFAFAQVWTAVLGVAVAAWAPMILRARWALYSAEPWRAVVGFGVAFAILVGCMVYYQRRRTQALREARAWQTLWESPDDAPTP